MRGGGGRVLAFVLGAGSLLVCSGAPLAVRPLEVLEELDLPFHSEHIPGTKCDMDGNPKAECGGQLVCHKGVCRYCKADHECPSLHRCAKPLAGSPKCVPETRKAWELAITDPWEALCTFLILLAAILSAAAGTGGGGIFVPVLISFSTLKAEAAVPLSQSMCLCGSIVNVSLFMSRRHPEYWDRPVIDYDCVMLFAPMLFLGVTLGVLLNQMSPQWIILLLLLMTLGVALWRTSLKGLRQLKKENEELASIAELVRQASAESAVSNVSEAMHAVGDVFREYIVHMAALTKEKVGQIVGVMAVWLVMLIYSSFSARVCTSTWGLSLVVLAAAMVGCTAASFYYITTALRKPTSPPQPTAIPYGSVPEVSPAMPRPRAESFQMADSLLRAGSLRRLVFPGVAFGAGFLGGLLGLGGGIILGPVLLEVGMHSEVVQASTASFVLLSSSLATVQFARAGLLIWHYAIWYGFVTVVATWVGQELCEKLARQAKRYSFITLAIAGVLGFSLVSLLLVGFRNVGRDVAMGRDMGFSISRLCTVHSLRIIGTDAAPALSWPSDLPPYYID